MSEIMLNILDAHGSWHGRVHGGLLERVVAALGAEPETIEELEAALSRFHQSACECDIFSNFSKGALEESWDAGLVIIDIAARVAAWDSSYSAFCHQGDVEIHGEDGATDFVVPYKTPVDWLVVEPPRDWRGLAERRRAERVAATLDSREILYGQLAGWLANEFLSRGGQDSDSAIHARWLMTPRDVLQDASPRDWLLARQHFIDMDLQWRAFQWAHLGKCPPGLSPDAHAYRYGGFGIHENVLYYELIRHLLAACRSHTMTEGSSDLADYLRAEQHRWLHVEQADLHGLSPFLIIGYERARLPFTVPAKEVFGDDDCPVCKEMSEISSPCFWHLDGCNMDNEFAFSFYVTREEWEEEQRSWQDFDIGTE